MPVKTINGLAVASVKSRYGLAKASIKTINGVAVTAALNAETTAWIAAMSSAGAGQSADSTTIADALVTQMKTRSYYTKLEYLVAMLGTGIDAVRVPIIDPDARGNMTNAGMVAGNFAQATGLQGTGGTNVMVMPITADTLGSSNSGGLFYWLLNRDDSGASSAVMGAYSSGIAQAYSINLSGSSRTGHWGNTGNGASSAVAAGNGLYYVQRSSATLRELFFNGSSLVTNTTSDAAVTGSNINIRLMGTHLSGTGNQGNKSRCGCAGATNGALTSGESLDLYSDLLAYLIAPTGR